MCFCFFLNRTWLIQWQAACVCWTLSGAQIAVRNECAIDGCWITRDLVSNCEKCLYFGGKRYRFGEKDLHSTCSEMVFANEHNSFLYMLSAKDKKKRNNDRTKSRKETTKIDYSQYIRKWSQRTSTIAATHSYRYSCFTLFTPCCCVRSFPSLNPLVLSSMSALRPIHLSLSPADRITSSFIYPLNYYSYYS